MVKLSKDRPINIAIIAMGGQGGGVLSKWILDLAESQGYIAQYTSVPGVAQRTGATIYYIELFPIHLAEKASKSPVLALTPIPGDVDIIIASEMMEAGRALKRGFVTENTTMIASNHRDYAIVEKQVMGDGRRDLSEIIQICEDKAANFICFDMDAAARSVESVISSVLFGALAGSMALPFEKQDFTNAIENTKKAVPANLRGFALGYDFAQSKASTVVASPEAEGSAPSETILPLLARMKNEFSPHAHYMITEGLKKLVDYQDLDYANLYLDRLSEISEVDEALSGADRNWKLTKNMARYLALAMAYDDTSRVAELKIRDTRFERFREEVRAERDQIVDVSEYMHPRLEEICDILPQGLGRALLKNNVVRRITRPFFNKGRRVTTTSLSGFVMLKFISKFRVIRRKSYRYKLEDIRIHNWMETVKSAADIDYKLACEVAALQRLLKGYGDTHARGMRSFQKIMIAYEGMKLSADADKAIRALKQAALADEDGLALSKALAA